MKPAASADLPSRQPSITAFSALERDTMSRNNGSAATEIGALLARLARTHQVVVVTHLAQVAAYADRQLVVDATEDGAVRSSSVRAVEGDLREAELARMLGGTVGASARQHAAELVAAARKRRKELARAA